MKRRIIVGVVLVAALITAALTTRWWLARLLGFVDAKATTIQSLSSLVQLLIFGGAGVAAWWRFGRKDKPPEAAIAPVAIADTYLHQLPPVLADFTDRVAEVAELQGRLAGNTRVYGLFGIGGVGKSDLAKKFAEDHLSERYPDAQLYVDLKGSSSEPKSVSEAQRHIISSCRGEEKLYKSDGVDLSAKYHDSLYNKRILLFLDNASSSEQVEPLIPPAECAMLITSRQKIVLPGIHAMTLQPLAAEDAQALLLRIAPRIGEHAAKIADLCGGLPQALRIAAGTITKYPDLSVDEYVKGLSDRNTRLEFIEASLDFSYELLHPIQRRQFCQLSVFPETFDANAVAAVWYQRVESARADLREFFKLSLVEWNEQAGRYRLQSLVRDFAEAHLPDSERNKTQWRHMVYYLRVLKDAGVQYLQGQKHSQEGRKLFDLEQANIQAAQRSLQKQPADESIAELAGQSYSYGASQLLAIKRPPADRLEWHQALLVALKTSPSNDKERRVAEAGNLTFVGVAHRDLGAYDETIELCEQAIAIAHALNEPREESSALGYSGVAHYYKGNYAEASTQIQRAIEIASKAKNKDTLGDIERLRYLGHAQRSLGKYEQGIAAYNDSLQRAREFGDLFGQNSALNALGRSHCDIGNHDVARTEYLPAALKLATEMGSPREQCYSLAHLGLAHRELGLYEEAKQYYENARQLAVSLGHRQLETYCCGGLGKTALSVGDLANALSNAERAVKLADEIQMRRAQQFWRTVIANTLLFKQEFEAAEQVAKQSLSYNSEWVNYRTLTVHGLILAKLKQTQPAATVFENAAIESQKLLSRTPNYFDARYFLGIATCGLAATKPDEATDLLTQATAVFEQAYQNCKSQGVVSEALRFLDEVATLDTKVDLDGPRKILQPTA